MNPNNPPRFNGRQILPAMSPAERKAWLETKGCPPGYLLITGQEAELFQSQMCRAQILNDETQLAIKELDAYGYWKTEPTLHDACGSAAFDARRYERATTNAIETLDQIVKHIETTHAIVVPTVAGEAMMNAHAAAIVSLTFLKAQAEARRDRTTPATPEPKQP